MRDDQLEEALNMADDNRPLDKVMIELGMVGEREVLQAKAQERGLPFVDIGRQPVDTNALSALPYRLAKSCQAFPIKRQDRSLWVAMVNPNDINAIDLLQQASGCRVFPVMAVPEDIQQAIEEHMHTDYA